MAVAVAVTVKDLKAEIEAGVLDRFREQGFTRVEDDGDEVKDNPAFEMAAYEVLLNARVSTDSERSSKAITSEGLTRALFPQMPTLESWDSLPGVEADVWTKIQALVWSLTNPNETGRVQTLLANDGVVLCRAKVGGRTKVQVAYVTDSEALIMADFLAPLKDKIRVRSESLARNLNLLERRQLVAGTVLVKQYDTGLKAATIAGKAKLALSSTADGA